LPDISLPDAPKAHLLVQQSAGQPDLPSAIAKKLPQKEAAKKTDKPVEYKSEKRQFRYCQRVAVESGDRFAARSLLKRWTQMQTWSSTTTKDICPVAKTSQPATTGVN
jgi:hypothetical protein